MDNVVTAQLTSSAVIAYAIEWVKKSKYFPWINTQSKNLNRLLMVAASGLAAIGIHTQFDSASGTLIITGLTTATLLHGAWELVRSSIFTQMLYDGVVQKALAANGAVPNLLAGTAAPPSAGLPGGQS